MNQKKGILISLLSLAVLLVAAGGVAVGLAMNSAPTGAAAGPIGTAFTYQGRLAEAGDAADGLYDLRFQLYDDPDGGSLLGTVTVPDHAVSDGLFTVPLDFGAVFNGEARWLEIAVRPGADEGDYTTLTPRQALTPAPYALYAGTAPWSGLTGMPAGFADGTDDGADYANVVVVAGSGGDYTSIQAALNSITDAGATNPYLVYVAPGVYEEQVTLKPYVTLAGAGEGVTIIRHTGGSTSPSTDGSSATVIGTDNAALRFLSVESDGSGNAYAIGIYNEGASPDLMHMTVTATEATSVYGVYNANSSPKMAFVTVSASQGSFGLYTVYNVDGSSPVMTNVTATAIEGTGLFTVAIYNGNASPTMTNVTAVASYGSQTNIGVWNDDNAATVMKNVTATALGGESGYGVFNQSASPTMTDVAASASEASNINTGVRSTWSSLTMTGVRATGVGGNQSYGVADQGSSLWMNNVTTTASGGATSSQGVALSSPSVVTVTHSIIQGETNAITVSSGASARLGTSQLLGLVTNSGALSCILSYDETFAELNTNCQ